MSAQHIRKEYDELLRDTHATDLYDFCTYYNLHRALRAKVNNSGRPPPPARQIRPTTLVWWNATNAGFNEFSRAMTYLARNDVSENPLVRILHGSYVAKLTMLELCIALGWLKKMESYIDVLTIMLYAKEVMFECGI